MSKKLTKNQTIKLATERGETASYSGKTKKFYFSKFADPIRKASNPTTPGPKRTR